MAEEHAMKGAWDKRRGVAGYRGTGSWRRRALSNSCRPARALPASAVVDPIRASIRVSLCVSLEESRHYYRKPLKRPRLVAGADTHVTRDHNQTSPQSMTFLFDDELHTCVSETPQARIVQRPQLAQIQGRLQRLPLDLQRHCGPTRGAVAKISASPCPSMDASPPSVSQRAGKTRFDYSSSGNHNNDRDGYALRRLQKTRYRFRAMPPQDFNLMVSAWKRGRTGIPVKLCDEQS